MPRRGIIKKRKLVGDQKYGSTLIARFISTLLKKGKKNTAERIVYGAMDQIQGKTQGRPAEGLREGHRQRPAPARDQVPPGRRRDLPGAHRSRDEPVDLGRLPLADQVRRGARRPDHDRQADGRNPGRPVQQGRGGQEARRHP